MTAQTYEEIGHGYARLRRPDSRIEAAIVGALDGGSSVLNVGAGTGSYEPRDRAVVAVEPSTVMLAQRASGTPAVRGVAEALPFAAGTFDAAMAVLTIHHWTDWPRGVAEMQRVARRRAVILTHDSASGAGFWLFDYFPGILERDRVRMPPLDQLIEVMGAVAMPLEVPFDCTDGFLGAYWREPARYLEVGARAAISGFLLLTDGELANGLARLTHDLEDGTWRARHGALLKLNSIDLGYRLVVGEAS